MFDSFRLKNDSLSEITHEIHEKIATMIFVAETKKINTRIDNHQELLVPLEFAACSRCYKIS